MDESFKKPTSFSVTQQEDKLIQEIMKKDIDKIEILRRGISSYCEELNIDKTQN